MRVAILTAGRFHVLDLARELARLGHAVAFHSLVPPWITRRYGLPARCNRWLGPLVGPAFVARRALAGTRLDDAAARLLAEATDRIGGRTIGRCDAFIGMSGMSLHTLERLRRAGAVTFLERGSMHIEAQRDILRAAPDGGAAGPPDWVVARERAEYAAADVVTVPSRHAEASFRERGHPAERLERNPYGVSLVEFPPTLRRRAPGDGAGPRILYVGGWTWRKGVDVLVAAFRQLAATRPGLELHHVGPLVDLPFPDAPGIVHHAPVPQAELTHHYAAADVSVLASREDGFGMVLSQALASGLPIVCTQRTGGPDLAELLPGTAAVTVVPPDDAAALAAGLAHQLDRVAGAAGEVPRDLLGVEGRRWLTWEAYAARWHATLLRRVGA